MSRLALRSAGRISSEICPLPVSKEKASTSAASLDETTAADHSQSGQCGCRGSRDRIAVIVWPVSEAVLRSDDAEIVLFIVGVLVFPLLHCVSSTRRIAHDRPQEVGPVPLPPKYSSWPEGRFRPSWLSPSVCPTSWLIASPTYLG